MAPRDTFLSGRPVAAAKADGGEDQVRVGAEPRTVTGSSELGPAATTDRGAPAATEIAKRTATLLRDARSVQRRLDALAAAALAIDDPTLPRIAEARGAVERLVVELTYRKPGAQRRAKPGPTVRRASRGRPAWCAPAAPSAIPGSPPTRSDGR